MKKHPKSIKRSVLELKKETIVQLGDDRLKQAVGGVANTTNSACCTTTWK